MADIEPLLVFSDDWGRHPSSAQSLVKPLLSRRRVVWVNTIGTRKPSLAASDLKRAAGKLATWLRPDRGEAEEGPAPHVISPLMWPSFGSSMGRWANTKMLTRAVTQAIHQHLDQPPVAITTLPIVADLMGKLPVSRWVYYMVDDLSAWPGLDGKTLRKMEEQVLEKADAVAVVGPVLAQRAEAFGHKPLLLTHGVDLTLWRQHEQVASTMIDHPLLTAIAKLPGPRAVFWGLIDARLDRSVLAELSRRWNGSILLVGPTQGDVSDLRGMPKVHLTGALPQPLLPALAKLADVLIMPYADMPATRAMQPLKLMEYLATDRPVVVCDLPATTAWGDCADVVDRTRFVERALALSRSLTACGSQVQARRWRLAAESWQAKSSQLEGLIHSTLRHVESRVMAA